MGDGRSRKPRCLIGRRFTKNRVFSKKIIMMHGFIAAFSLKIDSLAKCINISLIDPFMSIPGGNSGISRNYRITIWGVKRIPESPLCTSGIWKKKRLGAVYRIEVKVIFTGGSLCKHEIQTCKLWPFRRTNESNLNPILWALELF
ncbi:hypothetical protein ABKN59_004086 [Abortiporus biennis]